MDLIKIQNKFKTLNQANNSIYCYFQSWSHPSSPTWQQRLYLRKTLVNYLERHISIKNKQELLTPGEKPYHPSASISISHCKILGGFIVSFDPQTLIGLDIEEILRVKLTLTNRISQKEEITEAPQIALLWVAKESALKCIPQKEHKSFLISQIFISNWNLIAPKAYSFCFQAEDYLGTGIAFIEKAVAIASSYLHFADSPTNKNV